MTELYICDGVDCTRTQAQYHYKLIAYGVTFRFCTFACLYSHVADAIALRSQLGHTATKETE